MRKTTILTLAFSSLLVLPAMAQLGQVWTDFQSYSVDMQNYLRNNLSETVRPLEMRSQNAINNSSGESNIPNPIEVGRQIRRDILFNPTTDRFENNPVVRANALSNEINRHITRGSIESVMGRDGQVRLKAKLQNTEAILDNIEEISRESDNIFQRLVTAATNLVPQNPLASLESEKSNLQLQAIKLQQEQTKIISETLAQSIQTHQSLQYSNLNLANISQQMEEMNRARRVDGATEAARLLRTTSQINLWGREEN